MGGGTWTGSSSSMFEWMSSNEYSIIYVYLSNREVWWYSDAVTLWPVSIIVAASLQISLINSFNGK